MALNFDDLCFDVLYADTPATLKGYLLDAAGLLGFERFCGFIAIDQQMGQTKFINTGHNTPEAYISRQFNESLGRQDPVMQFIKHSHRPLAWNFDFYRQAGKAAEWEDQAPYGYGAGISSAMHMPNGRHFSLTFCATSRLRFGDGSPSEMKARAYLLCTYAYEAAARLVAPELAQNMPQLTNRERACLQWTLAGKTAWEVGEIVHLSERTVSTVLSQATRKLDCVNKHQAALRALQLGLIQL